MRAMVLLLSLGLAPAFAADGPAHGCQPDQHWVESYTRVRNGKVESVSAYCRSNPSGYPFWKNKPSDLRPKDWPNKAEKDQKWTVREKEMLFDALGMLPSQLSVDAVRSIHRMRLSKFGEMNGGANGNGMIVLYNPAFESTPKLARVLAHEISHIYYEGQTSDWRGAYQLVGKWSWDNDFKGWVKRACCYVEEDDKIDPEEDYANNIEYYLFDRGLLNDKSQPISNWIHSKFGDTFRIGPMPKDVP